MVNSFSKRVASLSTAAAEVAQIAKDVISERKRHRPSPPVPGRGLVLDVGAGQRATPRADVVVDKYIADDFERSGNLPLDISKPLVIADAEALPFVTGVFAYVVASHVLEHATDPERFAAELSRVGRAGYVQVPTRAAELTFGWPFHPWLIDMQDGVLVFRGREAATAPVGEVFHEAATQSKLFSLWFAQHRSLWHHSVDWEGTLAVSLAGGRPEATTAAFDAEQTAARIRELTPRGLRGPRGTVLDALCCPVDFGTLQGTSQTAAETWSCAVCDRAYPVVVGVPLLLEEAAR